MTRCLSVCLSVRPTGLIITNGGTEYTFGMENFVTFDQYHENGRRQRYSYVR